MSEMHTLVPTEQWISQDPNYTYLHHPTDATPFRGFNFDRDSTKPPAAFGDDRDFNDGMHAWKMAAANAANVFEVGVLVTDPSRPDGLGDIEQLRELVSAYDMIGHVSTRGVVHAIEQHGRWGGSEIVPAQWLGHHVSHPEYQGTLDMVLAEEAERGSHFSIDPSLKLKTPEGQPIFIPSTRIVQQIRDEVFTLASDERIIGEEPSDAVEFTDIIHADALGHLVTGIAGLQMDLAVLENPNNPLGLYPNSMLLIVPGELSDVIEKQKLARGFDPNVAHDETRMFVADQRIIDDAAFGIYAGAARTGRIERG